MCRDGTRIFINLLKYTRHNNCNLLGFTVFVEGERAINGHSFSVHSYATPTKCDFCSRYMLGLIRQGLKCKGILIKFCIFINEILTKFCHNFNVFSNFCLP